MKGITLKIFITILFAGLIGIIGEIILKYDIDRLSENYTVITDEYSVNTAYTYEISRLLYRHQAVAANHVTADGEDAFDRYEEEAEELECQLDELLDEFGKRMTGDKREQIYHAVYSDYRTYLQNAGIALKFSREGSKGTASYYTVNIMGEIIDKVNSRLDDLNDLTRSEMDEAKERMDYYMRFSQICEIICIGGITAAVVVSLTFCVKITSALDRYNDSLEKEVEQKTGDLRRHSEKMLELQNNIIIGMANLIESRDGDTGEHVKRTSRYVEMLAQAARDRGLFPEILTDEYTELLIKAAPMHDIGKIAVPDSILQKPGKLTSEEFERIKSHAAEGGRIIREVMGEIEEKKYVDIAATVAEGHHEKWNGSGYPKGLSGDEIPLCARIMAIADVFDALISKRCYKAAMSLDEAFGIISESAGSHFDPRLAEVFVSLRPEIESYLKEL